MKGLTLTNVCNQVKQYLTDNKISYVSIFINFEFRHHTDLPNSNEEIKVSIFTKEDNHDVFIDENFDILMAKIKANYTPVPRQPLTLS